MTSLRGVPLDLRQRRLRTCHSEAVRLLVVEDEAGMAAALAKGLGAEGFVVDVVADGPAGLEAARFGGYDAVVLDVMLPGMSGYTVVKTLRAEENWVPVLMLTAKDGEYDEADGLDYGADDYLTKPFSFVVLLARLRALLRRDPAPRAAILEAAGVRLDPGLTRVAADGEDVALSRREYLAARAPAARASGRGDQGGAPRRGLGCLHDADCQRRRGLRRLPAPQARPGADRDGPRRRLPDAPVRERLARLGLRSRLMAVGLVGVAAALVFGGLLLYAAVAVSLDRATVGEARSSADDVARLVEQDRLPDPVPVSGALVVQVLDGQNRVVAASATADRLTSIVTRAEAARLAAGGSFVVPGNRTGLSGELRLAAHEAGPAGDRVLVVAGVPTADLQTSQRALRTLMLVFFPLFLLLLAVIAWWVIGRTLRPVEELRRGAARIGESGDPTERLPVLPTRDEISALATTLNDMLAKLASSSAKQRAFVADAAHELRSPLATMRTQLEVAQRVGEGGDLPADLLPEVGRLAALVEDLLVLARSANEAGAPDRTPVELAEVVRAVAGRYAAARVPVVVAPPSGAAAEGSVVEVDRGDLERALGNLVDNAVRHAGSRVTLGWQGTGELRAWVVDDGNGVPAHERERVFDRFARLDDARDRDSGGSGLGLSITRELLRRNGARVWLEDAAPGLRAVVAFGRPQR